MGQFDIRNVVDPIVLKLREELMGSGISFGKLQQAIMPTVVVVVGGDGSGGTEIDTLGYIKGITTLSGSTTIGTLQKELSFTGTYITSAGIRTTVAIGSSPVGGDISGILSNATVVKLQGRAVSSSAPSTNDVLTWNGSQWTPTAPGMTNPMTTAGDLIYGGVSGTPTRLPVGSNGQYLVVASGLPAWQGLTGVPRQVSWYEEGTLTTGTAKGPLRRIDVNCTISGCYIYVKTAPTGAAIIVDIKRATSPNGTYTTIFSSTPQIAASADNGSSTNLSITSLSAGDYLRMDITQVGSTVAGSSMTVDLNMVTR